jgi:cytochrome c oxidase subunit I+III
VPDTGWGTLNLIASIGAFILATGVVVFLVNFFLSKYAGAIAGDNPWGADTLEWATSSPPPDYNFLYLPTVQSGHALWTQTDKTPIVKGLSTEKRETLVTSVLEARPELRFEIPGTSIWPLMVALATGVAFVIGIFTPWAFAVAAVLAFAALAGWFWSDPDHANLNVIGRDAPEPSTPPKQLRVEEA